MTTTPTTVKVWDLPVRLFHWGLVAAIVSTWLSSEYAEQLNDPTLKWHRYNGYAILVLVVFRLIWGFVGSTTARWSTFVVWPWIAARYGFDLIRGRDRKFLGHNPLGTYMILGLLAAVAVQASLGLMVMEHNETTWGPLYKLLSEEAQRPVRYWHKQGLYWVILPLAGAHIAANVLYGLFKRDPLIRAMITGRKPAADYEDAPEADVSREVAVRAVASLALAAALVFGTIKILGGKLLY